MSIKTTLKSSVAAAALFAVSAPAISTPADAGLANGNDNGVVISGALNRSLQYVDNGLANGWTNTDGGTDNSRLRILVSGQLTESIKVGGTWEANLPISQGQGATTTPVGTSQQGTIAAGATAGTFGFRKTDIKFSHATMGSFSIGQGTVSSDNKPSMDGTVSNNSGMSHGGSVSVYDETANTTTAFLGSAQFSSYFGGRMDRIRYDTPKIAGFGLSATLADNDYYDAGLTYGASFGDMTVGVGLQMRHLGGADSPAENFGGGVALKHASGLSAGAHYGKESGSGQSTATNLEISGSSWGVEAGYTTSAMNSLGATSVNVIYTEADDTVFANFEAESIQVHFRQKMPAGLEAYAAYEVASFDDGSAATSLDDISVFLVGTKLSF
jgi:hypothetical protein